jgi:hypothetical protein
LPDPLPDGFKPLSAVVACASEDPRVDCFDSPFTPSMAVCYATDPNFGGAPIEVYDHTAAGSILARLSHNPIDETRPTRFTVGLSDLGQAKELGFAMPEGDSVASYEVDRSDRDLYQSNLQVVCDGVIADALTDPCLDENSPLCDNNVDQRQVIAQLLAEMSNYAMTAEEDLNARSDVSNVRRSGPQVEFDIEVQGEVMPVTLEVTYMVDEGPSGLRTVYSAHAVSIGSADDVMGQGSLYYSLESRIGGLPYAHGAYDFDEAIEHFKTSHPGSESWAD